MLDSLCGVQVTSLKLLGCKRPVNWPSDFRRLFNTAFALRVSLAQTAPLSTASNLYLAIFDFGTICIWVWISGLASGGKAGWVRLEPESQVALSSVTLACQ
jgi:hypothetical protein